MRHEFSSLVFVSFHRPIARTFLQTWPAKCLLIASLYFLCGRIGLLLAIPPEYATAIWPPSGLALVGLLLFGPRYWPGVWLGSFCINLGMGLDASNAAGILHSVCVAASIGAGASLQAAAGASLVGGAIGWPSPLIRNKDILYFMALGGPVSCLIGATWGVATLACAGTVPYGSWLSNWSTWWVGDTLGVWIFATISLVLAGQPRAIWRKRVQPVALPLAVSFAAAIGVFWLVQKGELARQRRAFIEKVEESATRLTLNTRANEAILHGLAGLFEASPHVDANEFHTFAAEALRLYGGIEGLSWIPRVPAARRTEFELEQQRAGFPGFHFTERIGDKPVPAGLRGEYFPLFFSESKSGDKSALGFDLASEPTRFAAMEEARDTGAEGVTIPVTLLRNSGRGVIVSVPVYDRTQDGLDLHSQELTEVEPDAALLELRRERLHGFVFCVFHIEHLLQAAMGSQAFEQANLRIEDITTPNEAHLVFDSNPEAYRQAAAAHGTQWDHNLEIGSRVWQMHFTPTLAFLSGQRSMLLWSVLAGALLFTSTLGYVLLTVTGGIALVEIQVAERTIELERTNQELREREEFNRSLMESSADCVNVMDLKGRVEFMNKPSLETLGLESFDTVRGTEWTSFWPKDREAILRAAILAALDGLSNRFQASNLSATGAARWWDVQVSPIRDEFGRIRRLLSVSRDISERKQSDMRRATLLDVTRALSEAASLELAAMGILHAVCANLAWDIGLLWRIEDEPAPMHCISIWPGDDRRFTDFVQAAREIAFHRGIGLPGGIWAEARPKWIPDLATRTNFPRALAANRCGLHASFGFPIILRGQVRGVIEFFSEEVRKPDPATLELFSTIAAQVGEFMERLRSQEKLRQSEERFRKAIEHSAIGMAIVGVDGRWLQVNRALCKLTGRSESELLTGRFQDITHPDDLDNDLQNVEALLDGSIDYYQMEKRYLHRDGHVIWVFLAVTLLRDTHGTPMHFVSQIEDITKRHEAERRIKASLEEKDVLLREIHHRVKNNMQVISSLLRLQENFVNDPRDKDIFRECQMRIHSMALVHDRLYRSASLATIDFGAHLSDLVALVARGQSRKTAHVTLTTDCDPVDLALDTAIPLGLIATELVTNAYKHAFHGKTQGQLGVSLKRSGGETLVLTVTDDSGCLPPDFDIRKVKSLGMLLVDNLARQLRARFTLLSEADKQTSASISLPAA